MKPVEEVTACVWDFGTFLSIAEKLGETMERVYYCSPTDVEYQNVRECVKGGGLDRVTRLDDPLDPAVLPSIDLFVFPDIGFAGLQRHLRDLGKAVWGHMGATEIELYRTKFLEVLDEVGLPTVHNEKCVGLTTLANYLKDPENENKWVKVNRFRANMETWHHTNWQKSAEYLDILRVIFGGVREQVVFIVQDDIESEIETGYDGWCIDGQFPPLSFQGYEKKNELYLGSVLSWDDLADEIKYVNEAMAPVLADYGYRCWFASEIRVKDGTPYFIDITPRMPGQTGEHQLRTCRNFADVIWQGSNGIMVEPDFEWNFAAEATLHYHVDTKDPTISDEWKLVRFPEEALEWLMLYHYCKADGAWHFSAKGTDEIGVVIGAGDSLEESVESLGEHLELLKDLPVSANVGGFANLLESIKEAEKAGIKFGGRIPKPEQIYRLPGLKAA